MPLCQHPSANRCHDGGNRSTAVHPAKAPEPAVEPPEPEAVMPVGELKMVEPMVSVHEYDRCTETESDGPAPEPLVVIGVIVVGRRRVDGYELCGLACRPFGNLPSAIILLASAANDLLLPAVDSRLGRVVAAIWAVRDYLADNLRKHRRRRC